MELIEVQTEAHNKGPVPERRLRYGVLLLGWLVLALSAASFLVRHDLRLTFNSDIYYLPMLVKDVSQLGGSLPEWSLPPAGYFFPDLILYALFHAITGNAVASLTLCGAAAYLLFAGGWICLARRTASSPNASFAAQAAVLFTCALGLSLESLQFAAFWSMQLTMHFGVIAAAPWFLVLAHSSVTARGPAGRWASLAGLGLMAGGLAASDLLCLSQVLLPASAALLLLWIFAEWRFFRILPAMLAMAAGTAAGLFAPRLAGGSALSGYVQPDMVNSPKALRAFLAWLSGFADHQPAAFAAIIAILGAYAASIVVSAALSARGRKICFTLLMVSSFVASAVLLNIGSVLLMGNFFSTADARYALAFMFYPIFSLPVLLAIPKLERVRTEWLTWVAAACFTVIAAVNAGDLARLNILQRYSGFYPEWVEWMDRETSARGLDAGAGTYWDAKELMILSSNGLVMIQSTPYLVPYNWIGNTKWYDRFAPQFFLCTSNPGFSDRAFERDVTAKFGPPTERLVHEDRVLLVYGKTNSLASWYRNHPLRQEFKIPGSAALFTAADLPGDTGEVSAAARRASALHHRRGSLTLGPYCIMPAGRYRAEIVYSSAPGANHLTAGYWQLRKVVRNTPFLMNEGPLDPGAEKTSVEFSLDRISSVELLTAFTGSGELMVESIRFERLE